MATGDHKVIWSGTFKDFGDVRSDGDAFEGGTWLGKMIDRGKEALTKSHGNPASITEARDDALSTIASTMLKNGHRLKILDFGGGIGVSYLKAKASLPEHSIQEFVIVEKSAVCAAGKELFRGHSQLQFRPDMPPATDRFDIVHCGSSIHYVDEWRALLGRFVDYRPQYLLFSDLPAANNPTFVTAQQFHGESIPVRFWNLDEFTASVEELGYLVILKTRFRGDYWGSDATIPMDNLSLVTGSIIFRKWSLADYRKMVTLS